MLNTITLQGRLSKLPELKTTAGGKKVTHFDIAIQRDFGTDGSGNKIVDWFRCVAWENMADFICKYFNKGDLIIISGAIQMTHYTDRNGDKKESPEVIVHRAYFGGGKKSNETQNNETQHKESEEPQSVAYVQKGFEYDVVPEDDLPF